MLILIFARLFERLIGTALKQDHNKVAEWNGNEIILLDGLILNVN